MPLPVTPTGIFSRHFKGLIYLLAASPTFQTIVGAADADSALQFIHWPHAPDSVPVRPRAIVQPGDLYSIMSLGTGTYRVVGNGWLSLEFLPTNDPPVFEADLIEFTNRVGAILKDMWTLKTEPDPTGLETFVNLTGTRLEEGPSSCIPQEENGSMFYGVVFEMHWV